MKSIPLALSLAFIATACASKWPDQRQPASKAPEAAAAKAKADDKEYKLSSKHLGNAPKASGVKSFFTKGGGKFKNPFLVNEEIFSSEFDLAKNKFPLDLGLVYTCGEPENASDIESYVVTSIDNAQVFVELDSHSETDKNFSYLKVLHYPGGMLLTDAENIEDAVDLYAIRKSKDGHILLGKVSLSDKKVSQLIQAMNEGSSLEGYLDEMSSKICINRL